MRLRFESNFSHHRATLPDDSRSFSLNVVSLNILVKDVITYYIMNTEHTSKNVLLILSYFNVFF